LCEWPSRTRSAVSNHQDLLPGLDGRSASARRFRDLVNAFVADMGGLDQCQRGASLVIAARFAYLYGGTPVSKKLVLTVSPRTAGRAFMPKKTFQQERQCRQHQSARDRDRLLYTRGEVARLFGVSIATIIRMEQDGRLSGLKLGSTRNFRTMYRAIDFHRLAGVEVA
jgi:hypothetical protein